MIISYFCLILCILFMALWTWSYQTPANTIYSLAPRHETEVCLANGLGYFGVAYRRNYFSNPNTNWRLNKLTDRDMKNAGDDVGIHRNNDPSHSGWYIFSPHWLLVLVTGLLAIAIRPVPRWRASLRELFLFITLGAITVGTVVVVIRSFRQ